MGAGSRAGVGVWETGGVDQARRAGKGSLGEAGEARGRGRPHTRHCLDAAIIVSSEHPGSAGSAERELNKEPREEESGEKSARGAGSSPVGLFLCPATLLCAPLLREHSSELPDGDSAPPEPRGPAPGHHAGVLGRERKVPWRGSAFCNLLLYAEGGGGGNGGESGLQQATPGPHSPPSCCAALAPRHISLSLGFPRLRNSSRTGSWPTASWGQVYLLHLGGLRPVPFVSLMQKRQGPK